MVSERKCTHSKEQIEAAERESTPLGQERMTFADMAEVAQLREQINVTYPPRNQLRQQKIMQNPQLKALSLWISFLLSIPIRDMLTLENKQLGNGLPLVETLYIFPICIHGSSIFYFTFIFENFKNVYNMYFCSPLLTPMSPPTNPLIFY